MEPIQLPQDVIDIILAAFRRSNEHVSAKQSRMPNVHETSLDQSLVEHMSLYAAPTRLGSGWIVRIDTHFLGGGRHWQNWEIADLGVLVVFRKAGKVQRSKVVLLQSKRLYPNEQALEEDDPVNYVIGFSRLFPGDTSFEAVTAQRRFTFNHDSKYKALTKSTQLEAIVKYQTEHNIPVHYLLYHPASVPHSMSLPLAAAVPPAAVNSVGARVMRAKDVHAAMANLPDSIGPSFTALGSVPVPSQAPARHQMGPAGASRTSWWIGS